MSTPLLRIRATPPIASNTKTAIPSPHNVNTSELTRDRIDKTPNPTTQLNMPRHKKKSRVLVIASGSKLPNSVPTNSWEDANVYGRFDIRRTPRIRKAVLLGI